MTENKNSSLAVSAGLDDTAVKSILNELSCVDATYKELLENLKSQSCYKHLRGIGEQQFLNAPECKNTLEEQSQQIKMKFAEINLRTVAVDECIDTIISEKFQTNFLSTLKEEVLEIILKLYPDQDNSVEDNSVQDDSVQEESRNAQHFHPVGNSTQEKDEEDLKILLHSLKDVSKSFSHTANDIGKKVIDMSFENPTSVEDVESILSNIKEERIDFDDDSIGLENLSIASVSSVHTSDLSSFNDDISISSDEEAGKKREKLSFKMVEEEVEQLRAKRSEIVHKKKKKAKNVTSEDLDSKATTNDSSNVQLKSLPQRVRKPNSKYNTFDVISPLREKSTKKSTQSKGSTSVQESEIKSAVQESKSLPRKRGRPRKNVGLQMKKD